MKLFFLPYLGNAGHECGSDERFGKVDAPVIESVLGLLSVSELTESSGVLNPVSFWPTSASRAFARKRTWSSTAWTWRIASAAFPRTIPRPSASSSCSR